MEVSDGHYSVLLGSHVPFGTVFDEYDSLWLEVTIGAETLTPRNPIASVPYAYRRMGIYRDTDGNVGIGTDTPGARLDVSMPQQTGIGGAAAIGYDMVATGDYAVAMGDRSEASGEASLAIGRQATANQGYAIAMGFQAEATGSDAIAIGDKAKALNSEAIVIGNNAQAMAPGAIAMGSGHPTATGDHAVALGNYVNAAGPGSTALGGYMTVNGTGSVGIGLDTTSRTLAQANTLAVMGGNVGIGTVSPGSHRLSVKNNIGEQHGSSLWAENTNSGGIAIWAKNSNSTDTTLVVENLGTGHIVKGFGLGGEKFRVENDGDVVIAGNGYKPGGGSWADSSDIRLKQNVETMDGALDSMLALRGVTFEWREPEKHGNLTGTQMGMIAQEVEEVFPGWVSEGDDGFKILGIRGFEALTVEAVRELKHENEQLRAENEKLKRTVDAIQSEVERLAALVDGASGVTAWEAEQ